MGEAYLKIKSFKDETDSGYLIFIKKHGKRFIRYVILNRDLKYGGWSGCETEFEYDLSNDLTEKELIKLVFDKDEVSVTKASIEELLTDSDEHIRKYAVGRIDKGFKCNWIESGGNFMIQLFKQS